MKKSISYSLVLVIEMLFMSCDHTPKETSEDVVINYPDENEELYEFEAFSLAPYQINALLYLPDETANIGAATMPEVTHELGGWKWELKLGQKFQMEIIDWGEENGVALHKEELEDQSHMYDIEYIENTDDFIYYKRTLKNEGADNSNENVGVKHESYHCLGNHKIEGINYLFRTTELGSPKPITEYIKVSVKNVEEISNT